MNPCKSALIRGSNIVFTAVLNTICENLSAFGETSPAAMRRGGWLNQIPFLKKQTQFFPVSSPKKPFCPNPNPIQSQFKPNPNPIIWLYLTIKNTVLICVNQCLNTICVNLWLNFIPFYAKRTQTSPFSAQKQRFSKKTNPKQTQIKPKQSQTYTVWAIWAIFTRRFLWRIENQVSSIEDQKK